MNDFINNTRVMIDNNAEYGFSYLIIAFMNMMSVSS